MQTRIQEGEVRGWKHLEIFSKIIVVIKQILNIDIDST